MSSMVLRGALPFKMGRVTLRLQRATECGVCSTHGSRWYLAGLWWYLKWDMCAQINRHLDR